MNRWPWVHAAMKLIGLFWQKLVWEMRTKAFRGHAPAGCCSSWSSTLHGSRGTCHADVALVTASYDVMLSTATRRRSDTLACHRSISADNATVETLLLALLQLSSFEIVCYKKANWGLRHGQQHSTGWANKKWTLTSFLANCVFLHI